MDGCVNINNYCKKVGAVFRNAARGDGQTDEQQEANKQEQRTKQTEQQQKGKSNA